MRKIGFFACLLLSATTVSAQTIQVGATEKSVSRSEYFTWINNTNEGSTEQQTLANLEFFEWMRTTYGMQLDIYAFDSGLFDLKNKTMTFDAPRFHRNYPNGLGGIYDKASRNGIRLGLWGGPDGFGDTPATAEARKQMLEGLCRDYNWALFKFDAVCGELRKEKMADFADLMTRCRKYSPDLILLNHRLGLEEAQRYATTFLWEGRESYIDVNAQPATTSALHHRVGAMSRGLVSGLKRLTEDHGVCLSSCLDFWDDELVLQTFNRSLILSPQIYGNPWLLRDDEMPKLARIFVLSKRWASLLTDGITLPESYGPYAVARGNRKTRVVTLRNLTWQEQTHTLHLNGEMGLGKTARPLRVMEYHPSEQLIGEYKYGEKVQVTVPPFRSMLLLVSSDTKYEVPVDTTLRSRLAVRPVAQMRPVDVPSDAQALYEATVFAADNNALEVRSLQRSGESAISQVRAARDAFFQQKLFVGRGLWDKYLFDGDMGTFFSPSRRKGDIRINGGCFRLDLGEEAMVDSIVVRVRSDYELQPLVPDEGSFAQCSSDLREWSRISFVTGHRMVLEIGRPMRYLKMNPFPDAISEVEVYAGGRKMDSGKFRASNLFADNRTCVAAYGATFRLDDIPEGSVLCVAVDGEHGVEGAYAALRVDGEYIGAPDRVSSYPANPWENVVARSGANYTYLFPLTEAMKGKTLEAIVMNYDKEKTDVAPKIWIFHH